MRQGVWGLLAGVLMAVAAVAAEPEKKADDGFFAPLTAGATVGLVPAEGGGFFVVTGKLEKGKTYSIEIAHILNDGVDRRTTSFEVLYTVTQTAHNFVVLDGPSGEEFRLPIHSVKSLIVLKPKKAP